MGARESGLHESRPDAERHFSSDQDTGGKTAAQNATNMSVTVPWDKLAGCDLIVDEVYSGGAAGTAGDDPIARLLPVGTQGGFRYSGSPSRSTVKLLVLYTSGANEDWPDHLDVRTGTFSYYGDNRNPGHELHDTPRRGNLILRDIFADAHDGPAKRARVPPIFLFERAGVTGRDVRFRGLLVPGSPTVAPDDQLVAIWRHRGGDRFQNYRAIFTVLDVPTVPRAWIDLVLGTANTGASPPAWKRWCEANTYSALFAPPTTIHRGKAQQLPQKPKDVDLLHTLWAHFKDRSSGFEHCAADLFRMSSPGVDSFEVTQPSRDGGRDVLGLYAIGPEADPVRLDFALEAKCYKPGSGVGVKAMARLISRLRHRQFGILATTSYVQDQAYKEVRDDGHPVVILAGQDLVNILKDHGLGSKTALQAWLTERYGPPL